MNRAVAPIDNLFRVVCREGEIGAGVSRIRACRGKAAIERIGKVCVADYSGIASVANAHEILAPRFH
jgi:hypothetical protein